MCMGGIVRQARGCMMVGACGAFFASVYVHVQGL